VYDVLWLTKALPSLSFLEWAVYMPGLCPTMPRALFVSALTFAQRFGKEATLRNLFYVQHRCNI
jgi:hypothetical protein